MKLFTIFALAGGAVAWGGPWGGPSFGAGPGWIWGLQNFTNLVTFGDSYTDETGLSYFQQHNGSTPPPGTVFPISYSTPGGGITWDRWVSIYTGATLYDYAVSGAVCSNKIIFRYLASIFGPFPDVIGYEIPQFVADTKYVNASTGTNTYFGVNGRHADNTVYAIWIGTNDLGVDAFLTDSQLDNTTITNFTDCVFSAFDSIYQTGGRFFVLMNTAPLQLSALYGLPGHGGAGDNHYWPDKETQNLTEISYKMLEYTTLVNKIYSLQVPFDLFVAYRWPGASIAIYDVHGLITDIYNRPSLYLNGTTPANVTGFYYHCDLNATNCVKEPGDPDSFLWYDELHPTQRTDQVIADNFIDVIHGNSTWATYW